MARDQFTLRSLSEIDGGRLATAFAHALARCEADCRDRPGVDASRTITVKTVLTPQSDEGGHLHGVDVQFEVNDKLPKRASKTYNMQPAADGGLFYNEFAPENGGQRTLDDAPSNAERKDG